MVITWKM